MPERRSDDPCRATLATYATSGCRKFVAYGPLPSNFGKPHSIWVRITGWPSCITSTGARRLGLDIGLGIAHAHDVGELPTSA
jgi:hypothetical protein